MNATTTQRRPVLGLTPEAPAPTRAGVVGRLARQAQSVLVESRPRVQGIFLLRFLTAAAITGAIGHDHSLGAAAWLCATISIYVLNGLTDIEGDRLNGSRRPLAVGRLGVRAAAVWCTCLAVVALAVGALLSTAFVCLVLAYLGLGAYYSLGPRAAKLRSGSTAVVVLAGGLLTYAAGHTAGGGGSTATMLVLAGSMSAWMIVGSLVKDLADLGGDAVSGRQSVGVVHGSRRVCVVAGCLAVGISGKTVLAALFLRSELLLGLGALVGIGTTVMLVAMARRATWGAQAPYQSFMTTQYAAHGAILVAL